MFPKEIKVIKLIIKFVFLDFLPANICLYIYFFTLHKNGWFFNGPLTPNQLSHVFRHAKIIIKRKIGGSKKQRESSTLPTGVVKTCLFFPLLAKVSLQLFFMDKDMQVITITIPLSTQKNVTMQLLLPSLVYGERRRFNLGL